MRRGWSRTAGRTAASRTRGGALAAALAACALGASPAQAGLSHFYYDANGRLVGVTAERSQVKNYGYDAADNRTFLQLAYPLPASSGQQLQTNECLLQDQSLTSPNGAYVLTLQSDGRLGLWRGGTRIWVSDATAQPGAVVNMQPDGNLTIHDAQWTYLWGSGPTAQGAHLAVQNDGNLVIYSSAGAPLWSSNSGGR